MLQEESEDKKLPELEDDKTTEVYTAQSRSCEKHYMDHTSSREVQCRKCGVGYLLGGGEIVKEGHIYIGNTRII